MDQKETDPIIISKSQLDYKCKFDILAYSHDKLHTETSGKLYYHRDYKPSMYRTYTLVASNRPIICMLYLCI